MAIPMTPAGSDCMGKHFISRFETNARFADVNTTRKSKGSSSQHETIENERASSLKEASMGKELSKKNTLTRKGYIFSSLNVMFDSYGVVLTKQYGARFTSWQINLVRFGFAGVFMLLVSAWFRVYKRISGRSDASKYYWYQLPRMKTSSWARISLGVAFATFACPALSNYAVFEIPLGLALTLFSIAPLYTIPLVWIMKGEKPTKRGITGAMIAVTGVVLLVLFGSMND
jgi:drug/metabolite transporter (DMT)-like permease